MVPPQVKCPTCRKSGDWFAGKYGPFCSHRCKLVDLGKWFNGVHAISEPIKPEHLETFPDRSPDDHPGQPEA